MLQKKGETKVKLIDFGLSRRILPGTVVKDMIGTPEFVGWFSSLMKHCLKSLITSPDEISNLQLLK